MEKDWLPSRTTKSMRDSLKKEITMEKVLCCLKVVRYLRESFKADPNMVMDGSKPLTGMNYSLSGGTMKDTEKEQ